MTTTKERILELINSQGVNVSTFFSSVGLSYSNFKGKQLQSSPSADVLVKIKTKFPDANMDWILTGEGRMLKTEEPTCMANSDFLEKIISAIEGTKTEHRAIIDQNGQIIAQNGAIIKQNSDILGQNAQVISQNSALMHQNSEFVKIITKLSEKVQ